MPQNRKGLERKRGDHSKPKEMKKKIIKIILYNNGSVSEPEIRKFLEEENNKFDQAGINRHLHQLKKEGCIKFIPAKKSKYFSRSGLPNHWCITKIEHLKNIHNSFSELQLNKFEKSLSIFLREYGYTIESPQYPHFIILLFLSDSFFNMCLDKGIESIRSTALIIFRRDKDPKNERLIKELLNECNATYIRRKLNFEMSAERFRQVIEELAHNTKEISEEFAWRQLGVLTEKAREEFIKSEPGKTIFENIRDDMYYNAELYPRKPRTWIESFFEKFKEKVPELSKIPIESILQTQDEYQDMSMKIDKLLSLIGDQQRKFDATYLNLVFEHFLDQDLFTGVASTDEIDYAERTKEILEEYFILNESKSYVEAANKLILSEQENIHNVLAKNKDIFTELIEYYGY